jgi:hypothetical protein
MNREKQLETTLTIAVGMIVLYYVTKNKYFLPIATAVGISGLFIKPLAKWITWGWEKLSEILGYVSSKIILSALFFLILTPIAFMYRLFNKDTLNLKNNKRTLFKVRNHLYTDKDLENIW